MECTIATVWFACDNLDPNSIILEFHSLRTSAGYLELSWSLFLIPHLQFQRDIPSGQQIPMIRNQALSTLTAKAEMWDISNMTFFAHSRI